MLWSAPIGNVQVRVISDDDKAMDAGSDIDRLERIPRASIAPEHHMHHKFAIFDKSKLTELQLDAQPRCITRKIFS